MPWEIGLAETQQTLLANDLRSRIVVEADGQMRTGRDVVVAALLGADEFGFSTAPLIAAGCVMMRVCHLNTCPVGIATQDPVLRERFAGKPEHVINYLWLVAEERGELMACLGVATMEELVGQTELLEADPAIDHWKARGVDLSAPRAARVARGRARAAAPSRRRRCSTTRWTAADRGCRPPSTAASAVRLDRDIANVHRTVGGLLSGEIVRRHGPGACPRARSRCSSRGSAGQSFGAWLAPGVTFTLHGDANDYAGKGLSGGVFAVRPPGVTPTPPRRT